VESPAAQDEAEVDAEPDPADEESDAPEPEADIEDPWEAGAVAEEPEPELAERGGIFRRRRR
jgi:hypothetical protein